MTDNGPSSQYCGDLRAGGPGNHYGIGRGTDSGGSYRERPIPLDEALPIARQIVEALEYAHEKNIIHRDLKPANVKVTPDGVVKVLDFGLAKIADTQAPGPQRNPATSPTLTMRAATQAGLILGTAAYMAPEQARAHTVDRRADIWAFGAVLYEMLSGRMAFPGDNVTDILASVVKVEPEWNDLPQSTPTVLRSLITRCLTKDRKRRLQAIGEARLMLEQDLSPAAPAVSPTPPAKRPWAVLLYAALVTVSLLVLAGVHFRESQPVQPVLRYSIAAPEKSRVHTFAISPNGRYLAIAYLFQGKRRLYLRPLDGLAMQELRGTEDAAYPFWSPDSRSIGFFAEGKLKRVQVDGSPPQNLCDARLGRGGTWNRDGVIVFAPSNDGALMRVAAAGGVPVALTKPVKGETHRFPVFLPDGNRFLYLSNLGPEGTGGIHVADLGGKPGKRLLPDESSAFWQASDGRGFLLFHRNGTLMAQPTDLSSLQPVGDIFPLAEQLSIVNRNYVNASASSNRVLVYSTSGLSPEQQLRWHDRSGKSLGDVGTPSTFHGLALSPDDKLLAVARGGKGNMDSDIWLYDLARGTETRFTFDASAATNPVWSPDARRIAYASGRTGYVNIQIRETDGTGQDQSVFPGERIFRPPQDWSRDGRTLLYVQLGVSADLWAVSLASGQSKPAPFAETSFSENQARFSPDGRWITYVSNESGRPEVYVRPFPSGPGKWKISVAGGESPLWRSDGKEIFFASLEQTLMSAMVSTGNGANPTFSAGIPQPVFEGTPGLRIDRPAREVPICLYAVSSDGKRFLISHTPGGADSSLTVAVNWLGAATK